MKLAPEKIYLNDPVEAFQDDSMNPFDYVTWSEDPVHENDVEYIRKDLYDKLLKKVTENEK